PTAWRSTASSARAKDASPTRCTSRARRSTRSEPPSTTGSDSDADPTRAGARRPPAPFPDRMRLRVLVALPALWLAPAVVVAQIHASEHFTLTQKVSTTTITMEGDRPVARGRKLFGPDGVVKWGEVWTPGANWATTMEVDRDV